MKDISIIIVNYNGTGFIEDCLESIKENLVKADKAMSFEIIVIDNSSSDQSPVFAEEFCRENRDFKLIRNSKNLGFGTASNIGAGMAAGDFLLFLNPDCRILDGEITGLIDFCRDNEDSGAIGARILNSDGSLQFSCRAFPTLARQFYESFFCYRIFRRSRVFGSYFMTWWDHKSAREVDWVSGSFILVKKEVFKDCGGFKSDYFMYSEDTDLCLQLYRNGYRNYYYPFYSVEHADAGIASGDAAGREAEIWRSRRLYFKKNHSRLHALLLSFLYLLGIKNRIIIFSLGSLFSARIRKYNRTDMYFRVLARYFRKQAGGSNRS